LDRDWRSSPYVLLGDDILIGDKELAEEYRKIIRSLGVDVSPIKSHSSDKLFEFAKRLVLNGQEITPFPISALAECGKQFHLLANLHLEEVNRGWVWKSGISPSIHNYYQRVLQMSATYSRKSSERAYRTVLMLKYIRGKFTAVELVYMFVRRYAPNPATLRALRPNMLEAMWTEVLSYFILEEELFEKTWAKLDFTTLAMQTGLHIAHTCSNLGMAEVSDPLMESIPVVNVLRQIMQKMAEVSTKGLNSKQPKVMFETLKLLSFPLSDKVFSEREKHTMTRVGSLLGERLFVRLSRALSLRIQVPKKGLR